jgi:hypothetical protein
MRCLECRYDLRGQTVFRCPECGLQFDPANPTTYLIGDERKLWGAIEAFLAAWRRRWLRIGVVSSVVVFVLTAAFGMMRCTTCMCSGLSMAGNLRAAVQAWAITREDGTGGSRFNLRAALPHLSPRFDRETAAWRLLQLQLNAIGVARRRTRS